VRQAAEECLNGARTREAAMRVIRRHVRELGRIVDRGDHLGRTGERLAILGSAHKRAAVISTGKERKQALDGMAARYREAYELTGKAYPLLNWLTAEILLDWQTKGGKRARERVPGFDRMLNEQAAKLDAGCGKDGWSLLMAADAKLLRALADDAFDKDILCREYLSRKVRVSHGQFSSVFEQIDFLSSMAPDRKLAEGLAELGRLLR
jgi:hypothetical protein